jgi:YVTN family beta-propeller protein
MLAQDTVSVVDTSTYSVVATVSVGGNPRGIDVSPYGLLVFVTNTMSDTASVIDTTSLTIPAVTINVGSYPLGIAVAPDGGKVYIANNGTNDVSVVDTASLLVTRTIPVGEWPYGVAVSPDGSTVYVTNNGTYDISVIDTASETVTATIPVERTPAGTAVTPGGTKLIVSHAQDHKVTIIDTLSLTVTTTVPVGLNPNFMGKFIAGPSKSLLIEKGGSGTGNVKSLKLKNIDCGATCESNFQGGTQVKLKAKPDKGSVFKEWSGACSGIKKECYVTIEGGISKIVVATFLRYPTIRLKPVAKDFKAVKTVSIKKARFTVKNKTTKGKQSLNIGQISMPLSRTFNIVTETDGCSNTSLGPGGSCRFEIQYRPLLQGPDSATIEIPSNDPDSPLTIISVSGEGI